MIVRGRFVLVSCLAAGIAGCSAPAEQGPAPTTVQECRDDLDAGMQRVRQASANQSYSGGNAMASSIGAAIGSGISKGIYESRYNDCLIAVGGGASYTQVQSSRAPVPEANAVSGNFDLPTQYPLMPGDTQLWKQLTAAQQQRAIEFLRGGSTIRSSLSGDN
ncbi:hypothetical protein [Parasedimentitalea huanghaiensis]|uniref:Lipoprotein n=1 Tax=Parasedimentitalea huanghaiensis TaxID=2682100 RepID=A0A6L6WBX5_9RHOB|nr:hypothetical protein [Zongyanglinia huanghaiensis]MVO15060.1 hypothetical protein [Zongyanglinia huanghaiensis]